MHSLWKFTHGPKSPRTGLACSSQTGPFLVQNRRLRPSDVSARNTHAASHFEEHPDGCGTTVNEKAVLNLHQAPSISFQFVRESAIEAMHTNDRRQTGTAADLVWGFPLTNLAESKRRRQRLVERRRLRPGTHCLPSVGFILSPVDRIVQ